MIDPIQILFAVVITVLAVLLVVIGVEVFKILQEAKKTLFRVNTILDDVETITTSVAEPVEKMSGIIQGFQQGMNIMSFVMKLVENRKNKEAQSE